MANINGLSEPGFVSTSKECGSDEVVSYKLSFQNKQNKTLKKENERIKLYILSLIVLTSCGL